MKTYQQFQQDLKEVAPAILAAPYAIPALTFAAGAAANLAKGYLEARKNKAQSSVDYGQGGETKPRTPNVQRPSGKTTAAKTQAQVAANDRKEEARRRAQEKAQQRIDDLIGSDAERKAAAQARANQPQIQQGLRRQATRDRMSQAADRLGL